MLTKPKIGALLNITAAARQKKQGYPFIEDIDTAVLKAEVSPNLGTSIELVAVVAAKAGGLEDGAADAFDWLADAATQIARELRGG